MSLGQNANFGLILALVVIIYIAEESVPLYHDSSSVKIRLVDDMTTIDLIKAAYERGKFRTTVDLADAAILSGHLSTEEMADVLFSKSKALEKLSRNNEAQDAGDESERLLKLELDLRPSDGKLQLKLAEVARHTARMIWDRKHPFSGP